MILYLLQSAVILDSLRDNALLSEHLKWIFLPTHDHEGFLRASDMHTSESRAAACLIRPGAAANSLRVYEKLLVGLLKGGTASSPAL